MLENRGLAGIVLDLNRKSQLVWVDFSGGGEEKRSMKSGGRGLLLAKYYGRTKWLYSNIRLQSTGVGRRLRAIFTVQREHPPNALAFSCWKDLSEG